MFEHIEYYPGDPILTLVEKFKKDKRDKKVNLIIGSYYDEDGALPLLDSISQVETLLEQKKEAHDYLPMQGHLGFINSVQNLLFGENHEIIKNKKVATIQTIGGSGALKVASEFLKKSFPNNNKIFVSDPTWANHIGIFEYSGFEVLSYPYYDKEKNSIKENEMINYLSSLPEKSILILHPCCHNPTGVDLNKNQWDRVIKTIKNKNLIAFWDMAYLGLGDGFDDDIYPIKKALEEKLTFLVSNSFSKNLSLYGERIASLSVVCATDTEAELVLGQLKFTIRKIYSSPCAYGAKLAFGVLNNKDLLNNWKNEVKLMRERIKLMRQTLFNKLSEKLPKQNLSYIVNQKGLFSYTGLNLQQVEKLKKEFAVYILNSGRICIAGLNNNNIDHVVNSFYEVMKEE